MGIFIKGEPADFDHGRGFHMASVGRQQFAGSLIVLALALAGFIAVNLFHVFVA